MTDWLHAYELEFDLYREVEQHLRQRGDVLLTPVEAADARGKGGRTAPGSADFQGVALGGVHLEVELKSRTGKSRPKQLQRADVVRKMGGVYEVCRTVRDVHEAIEKAKRIGVKGMVRE